MTHYKYKMSKSETLALEKSEKINEQLEHISKKKLNEINKKFPKSKIAKSKDYNFCLFVHLPNCKLKFILGSDLSNKYNYEVSCEDPNDFTALTDICSGKTISKTIKNLIQHVKSHSY